MVTRPRIFVLTTEASKFDSTEAFPTHPAIPEMQYRLREVKPEGRYGYTAIPSTGPKQYYWGPTPPSTPTSPDLRNNASTPAPVVHGDSKQLGPKQIIPKFWEGGITIPQALRMIKRSRLELFSLDVMSPWKPFHNDISEPSPAFQPCAEDLMHAHSLLMPPQGSEHKRAPITKALLRLQDCEEWLEWQCVGLDTSAQRNESDENDDIMRVLNAACDILELMYQIGSYMAVAEFER